MLINGAWRVVREIVPAPYNRGKAEAFERVPAQEDERARLAARLERCLRGRAELWVVFEDGDAVLFRTEPEGPFRIEMEAELSELAETIHKETVFDEQARSAPYVR